MDITGDKLDRYDFVSSEGSLYFPLTGMTNHYIYSKYDNLKENIENFNKKALYILIREMTGSNTQHITRIINFMKSISVKNVGLLERLSHIACSNMS